MNVAIILPSLANKAPIIVARDLVTEINNKVNVDVYYFDKIEEVEFDCPTHQITLFKRLHKNYDVVHSHMLRPNIYMFLHFLFQKNVKTINTFHSMMLQDLKNSYNNVIAYLVSFFWILMCRSFNYNVCLTKEMYNYYKKWIQEDSLRVVYNGRQLGNDSQKIEPAIVKLLDNFKKDNKVIIGVAAGLSKLKGVNQLIQLLERNDNIKLLIIGDGPEKNNLMKLSESLNVTDRCLFLGYQFNAQRFYKYFNIYAMTSHSEGFPLVLLEAGLNGIPTVCSNIAIFNELYSEDEVTFFELNKIHSLDTAVRKLIDNNSEYSAAIKAKTLEYYSSAKMGSSYLNIYLS